jgi:hypothetical protein
MKKLILLLVFLLSWTGVCGALCKILRWRPTMKDSIGLIRAFVVLCTIFGFSSSGWAYPISLDFQAYSFESVRGTDPAPTDPVIGRIDWDAPSGGEPITALTGIDLVIDGHSYDLAEIELHANILSFTVFESKAGGFDGTDSFLLVFDREAGVAWNFGYTSSNYPTSFWLCSNNDPPPMVINTRITPEPNAILLLGVGLVGLAGFWRKRFRK